MKSLAELPRNPLRDPGYSLADRRREEEALRTAVDMLAPEHRPLCAFPLGDVPEVRLEYPHHHWLYTDDRPEPQMLDALGRLCGMLGITSAQSSALSSARGERRCSGTRRALTRRRLAGS